MLNLRSASLAAVIGLFAVGAPAQDPLNSTNFWFANSTFSLDPKDPEPVRSVFQVVEVDRIVGASDVHVYIESLNNAKPVLARWFQRPSNRGTNIVFIEVQAIPRHQGKPASAAFGVSCGVYTAFLIESVEDVRQGPQDESSCYAEPLHQDNGFKVIYPKAGTVMAYVTVVNPLLGTEVTDNQPVEADSTHRKCKDNKVDVFREKTQVGLVQASALVANVFNDHAPWLVVSYLNMDIHPHEWHEVEFEAMP